MVYLALLQEANEDKIKNGAHETPAPKRALSKTEHARIERAKQRVAQLFATGGTGEQPRRGCFTVPAGTVAVSGVMDDFTELDGAVVRANEQALLTFVRDYFPSTKATPKQKLDATVALQEAVYCLHHPGVFATQG